MLDNQAAFTSARKETVADTPKKSRHVALRFSSVLEHKDQLRFVDTSRQRADGMTKSINKNALEQLFSFKKETPAKRVMTEEELEADCKFCVSLLMC